MKLSASLLCVALWLTHAADGLAQTRTPPKPPTPRAEQMRPRFFRGSIGKRPVVLNLQRDGDTLAGMYAYERDGRVGPASLELQGRIEPTGQLTLRESDFGRQTGKFVGKLVDDPDSTAATIEGTWTRPDGTHESQFLLTEQYIAFNDSARQVVSQTITDRRYNVNAIYPQLAGRATPGALAFNRAAAALATKLVREFREGAAPEDHIGLDTDYNVLYGADDLVSVELSNFTDYGGAHPNYGYDGLTYDLRTVRAVTLASLFRPGTRYEEVLQRAAVASWAAQAKRLAAENGTPADDEPIVVGESSEHWVSWGLTPRGLVLYYDLPHVIAAFDKVFIPWQQLRDVLDPQGAAARFVRAPRP